jgi:hypothetical protein
LKNGTEVIQTTAAQPGVAVLTKAHRQIACVIEKQQQIAANDRT